MPEARLFDRRRLRLRRARHRPRGEGDAFFLHRAAEALLAERLGDQPRRFARALALGLTAPLPAVADETVHADLVASRLPARPGLVLDDAALPVREASYDLVVSSMLLHWANDPAAVLSEARRVLRPDGFFLAVFPGEETLVELRRALYEAEEALTGGIHPRVIPFIPVREAGDLLQRAGFALAVVDLERVDLRYRDPARLLFDLHHMGESTVLARRAPWSRRLQAATIAALERLRGPDGCVAITVELIVMAGFRPAPGQPRPARRGSARLSLAHVLGRR